ncbi:glycosyltransferase family 39 protein, partial [Patescibacteria group bacterium]
MNENIRKILFFVIVALFLGVRLVGVGTDIANTDSTRWHRRSYEFLEGLKRFDLAETYQHYQPGVTGMWITLPARELAFKYQMWQGVLEPKTLNNADFFPIIHGLSKASIIIVLAALLLFHMKSIEKLFNRNTALIYGFFMIVEPYLVGIDRWFHMTSLETYFAFASLLALFIWNKDKNKKLFIFSALFFALSVLSKLTSLILGPILLFILLNHYRNERDSKSVIKNIVTYGLVVFGVFIILFPALWADFPVTINKLIGSFGGAVLENVRNN